MHQADFAYRIALQAVTLRSFGSPVSLTEPLTMITFHVPSSTPTT